MFLNYHQDQSFLLPPSFKSFLGDSHEAVILSEIIDELDLRKLTSQYIEEGKGRPSYHPAMLLKVLFYGYMNQTFSSRKLANKLISDLGFMYIAGNNQPDFRTINRFRKEKGGILEEIFVQIVLKAKSLGLISFGTVSLDGTKIYANASNSNNYEVEYLNKKIQKLFDEASRIDEIEDKECGDNDGNGIPEELKTKEGRDAKRKEIEIKKQEAELTKVIIEKEIISKKEQGINQTRINTTDKDSRLMMMKRKDRGTGYNPQNLTENQFILTTIVPNSASDVEELVPILTKFHNTYGAYPKNQLADAGYASEENYQFLQDNKITSYVPHPKLQINIDDYVHNYEKNTYQDKDGNTYNFKQHVRNTKGGKRGRPLKSQELEVDEIKKTIYMTILPDGKKKFIKINSSLHQLYKDNDLRLYSEQGKEIYKKRSGCVENVFGNIKANLGFEKFLLRGFEGVQIERNLISLAHNLKKLIKFQVTC